MTGASTTDYALDGDNAIRTRLNGAVDKTWFHGARGPEYERTGSGSPLWYLYDGLGSVLGTVDGSGNLVHTRKYDVYGAVRASTGGSEPKHKFVGTLGHPSEDETGIVYMRARYMDSVTGRFVGEDPARSGQNWYSYADSRPADAKDRTGKETIVEINFTITIGDYEFSASVTVNFSTQTVVGGLRQMFQSNCGQRLAMFMFRRGLGATDSAISLMLKLLNDEGQTEEVWHAVVDQGGMLSTNTCTNQTGEVMQSYVETDHDFNTGMF